MKWLLALTVAVTCAGCDKIPGTAEYGAARQKSDDLKAVSAAEKLTAYNLIDPNSAQFREIIISANGRKDQGWRSAEVVCGQINAKNRAGAYVGFERFIASPKERSSEVDLVDPPSEDEINEATNSCSEARSYTGEAQPSACRSLGPLIQQGIDHLRLELDWAARCTKPRFKLPAI